MFGLLGAYTASYINPNILIIPSLLGLAYPYLLIGNILLFLYWLTRWKRTAWVSLVIILCGIPAFMTYYGTNSEQKEQQAYDLSLMSYNIHFFDIYGWSKEKNTKNKLFDYLNQFQGDIVCLQEFPENISTQQKQTIINNLSTYPYFHIDESMAFFSRIPIIRSGKILFNKTYTSSCTYCDILVPRDTIRIYNVHLESYKMGKRERQFMKELSEGLQGNNITHDIKNITSRLTKANKNRARQSEQIVLHIQKSPYNVIICGDFNDTPLSYTYRKIKGRFKDSFIEKGRGIGNTYIGEFPSFRIDYILHTPAFKTISYKRDNILLSDHYPVTAKIKIKKECEAKAD